MNFTLLMVEDAVIVCSSSGERTQECKWTLEKYI